MQLDLPRIIEHAADDVAQAGRAAAGTLGEFVHDLDPRVARRASRRRSNRTVTVTVAVVIVALVIAQRIMARRSEQRARRKASEATVDDSIAAVPSMPEAARTTDRGAAVHASKGMA